MTDFVAMMPFAAALGITITSADKAEVVGTLEHSPDRTTQTQAVLQAP